MDNRRASGRIGEKLESMGRGAGVLSVDQSPGYFGGVTDHHGGKAMSFGNTALGAAFVFGLAQAMWAIVGPALPPIIVHELRYEAGYITQDRTITTDGPWAGIWEADILDARTGDVVDGCAGGGAWEYPPGRAAPTFKVSEWVGNPDCELQPGAYVPRATYSAGEFRLVARGATFTVAP